MLLSRRKARLAWCAHEMQENRLLWTSRAFVVSHTHRQVQRDSRMVRAWTMNVAHTRFDEGLPVSDQDICIQKRDLFLISQILFLAGRELVADIKNHHAPTRPNARLPPDGL